MPPAFCDLPHQRPGIGHQQAQVLGRIRVRQVHRLLQVGGDDDAAPVGQRRRRDLGPAQPLELRGNLRGHRLGENAAKGSAGSARPARRARPAPAGPPRPSPGRRPRRRSAASRSGHRSRRCPRCRSPGAWPASRTGRRRPRSCRRPAPSPCHTPCAPMACAPPRANSRSTPAR